MPKFGVKPRSSTSQVGEVGSVSPSLDIVNEALHQTSSVYCLRRSRCTFNCSASKFRCFEKAVTAEKSKLRIVHSFFLSQVDTWISRAAINTVYYPQPL